MPEGVPTPPVELSGEALAEWGRMVDRLRQTRTLSTVDDAVLYQYSRLYAETEALAADQARTAELIDRLDSEIDAQPQNERGKPDLRLDQTETDPGEEPEPDPPGPHGAPAVLGRVRDDASSAWAGEADHAG